MAPSELPAPTRGEAVLLNLEELYDNLVLPPNTASIRVLDLEAKRLAVNAPLRGRLRVVSLEQCRPPAYFDALSYVWGEKTDNDPVIECMLCKRGRSFAVPITKNCRDALVAIRRRFGATTIWFDTACINQEDLDEKGLQVRHMGKVYEKAGRVFVWLGPATETSNRAMKHIRRRAAAMERLPMSLLASRDITEQKARRRALHWRRCKDFSVRLFNLDKTIQKEAITDVLDSSWVHRSWTFQELILARDPIFLCGDSALLWEDLLGFLSFKDEDLTVWWDFGHWRSLIDMWMKFPRQLQQPVSDDGDGNARSMEARPTTTFDEVLEQQFEPARIGLSAEAMPVLGRASDEYASDEYASDEYSALHFLIRGRHQTRHWSRTRRTGSSADILGAVLAALRQRQCASPHDHVYALHGIFSGLGLVLPPVDYKASVETVNRQFFEALVRWDKTYATLLLDARPSYPLPRDCPSWVPNWTGSNWPTSFSVDGLRDVLEMGRPRIDIDGPVLSIDSLFCGSVHRVSPPRPLFDGNGGGPPSQAVIIREALRWLVPWIVACRRLMPVDLTSDGNLENLCSLLPSPYSQPEHVDKIRRLLRAMDPFFSVFSNDVYDGQDKEDEQEISGAVLGELVNNVLADRDLTKYLSGLGVADQRCLFTTSPKLDGTSALFGSGPVHMRPGDAVFMLGDVPALMVLRQSEGTADYTVVGATLVSRAGNGTSLRKELVRLV